MGAALALAIMVVVGVGIVSLAVNAQGPFQGAGPGGVASGPSRASHPGGRGGAPPSGPVQGPGGPGGPSQGGPSQGGQRPARRTPRERPGGEAPDSAKRSERARDRPGERTGEPSAPPVEEPVLADVRPLSSQARAQVMSVVDERTLGPVTRSKLTLQVELAEGGHFEVTTRVAFPTPEDRARVKVGAVIPVRFDPDDHRRVAVDMEKGL